MGGEEAQQQPRTQQAAGNAVTATTSGGKRDPRWHLPARYEVRQTIGTGSYGSVYEAWDSDKQRLVAIKRIRHMFDDLVDCKRILREVSILHKLNHESVVQLYGVIPAGSVETFDELYMIMEICDSDMKKLCRTDVTLSSLHINTLLYNLLTGIKYLHSAGIYHRDLKPANCLVNQDCSVKICDFGLSRAMGSDPNLPDHAQFAFEEAAAGEENGAAAEEATTAGGTSAGNALAAPKPRRIERHLTGHVVTRWYRAPELILLQEHYTSAIDIWSTGCIYAELVGMLEGMQVEERGPLFPGTSCFPLSPDHKHKTDYKYHTRGKHDQLNMIFNLLGSPSEEEIERLEREDAKRYLRCFARREGEGLKSKFPIAPPESLDILSSFLQFNPLARPTVNKALEHELFNEIREDGKEVTSETVIQLEFEKEPDLDEAVLRRYFGKEMDV